jgi:cytochrome c peroxidase
MRHVFFAVSLLGLTSLAGEAGAQVVDPPPTIGSLHGVPVPEPAQMARFVRNRGAAIALGKALFWDTQLGSDGQACASCHFHAGADNRTKNQLSPGLLAGDTSYTHPMLGGGTGGPNYTAGADDFPFHKLLDPNDRNSTVLFDTNDVFSSQGTFAGGFVSVRPLILPDLCGAPPSSPFHVSATATRKVEPRNTPTVVNAAFNFRNFWDGRANNIFNGANPFGLRDVNARVVEVQPNGSLASIVVALENASLASQAVGPPLSDNEMSCLGRGFADLGHKMLSRLPLTLQLVAIDDSVLGPLRAPLTKGLAITYAGLVEQAFEPKYWSSAQPVTVGAAQFTLEEANFSLFFGLAVQLYEETLVSDQAPIDHYYDGDANALTAQEKRGLALFLGKGKCGSCHAGPELSNAASHLQAENQENGLVERMIMGDGNVALYDAGFYNTGVRPTAEDRGVGGTDPFGNPLSFAREAKLRAAGQPVFDPFQFDPCTFAVNPCVAVSAGERDAVDGAFKTPSLRNAELTGPYFHNGGTATLEGVVDFYNRGGDRRGPNGNDTTGFPPNLSNLDADIESLGLTASEKTDLVAFLKRPLTDDRVRWERAPFDHPELTVANGHLGNESAVTDLNLDGRADDSPLVIAPVGAGGRLFLLGPLQPF